MQTLEIDNSADLAAQDTTSELESSKEQQTNNISQLPGQVSVSSGPVDTTSEPHVQTLEIDNSADLAAQDTTSELESSKEQQTNNISQLPEQVSVSSGPVDTTSEPHVQTLEIDTSAELTVQNTTSELELSKEQQNNNISQLPGKVSVSSGPVYTTSEPHVQTLEIDNSADLAAQDTTSELESSKEQQTNNISQLPGQVSVSSGLVYTTSEPHVQTLEIDNSADLAAQDTTSEESSKEQQTNNISQLPEQVSVSSGPVDTTSEPHVQTLEIDTSAELTVQNTTSELELSKEQQNNNISQLPGQVSVSSGPVYTTSEPHVQTLEIDNSADLAAQDTTSDLESSKEQQNNNISQLPAQVSASSGSVDTTSEPYLETIEIIPESPNNQADSDSLANMDIGNSTKNAKKLHVKPNNHISEFPAHAVPAGPEGTYSEPHVDVIEIIPDSPTNNQADSDSVADLQTIRSVSANQNKAMDVTSILKQLMRKHKIGDNQTRCTTSRPIEIEPVSLNDKRARMTLKTLEKNIMGTTKSLRAKPHARTSRG